MKFCLRGTFHRMHPAQWSTKKLRAIMSPRKRRKSHFSSHSLTYTVQPRSSRVNYPAKKREGGPWSCSCCSLILNKLMTKALCRVCQTQTPCSTKILSQKTRLPQLKVMGTCSLSTMCHKESGQTLWGATTVGKVFRASVAKVKAQFVTLLKADSRKIQLASRKHSAEAVREGADDLDGIC